MTGILGDELLFEIIDHHVVIQSCLNDFHEGLTIEICLNVAALVSHIDLLKLSCQPE